MQLLHLYLVYCYDKEYTHVAVLEGERSIQLTRNVVVTTEKNGFPFIPVSHYAVGGYSMWVH